MISPRKLYYKLVDHRTRPGYWSLSKVADGMRKVHGIPESLPYGTSKDFREWDAMAKAASPVGYWITDVGLDFLQDVWLFFPDVFYNVRRRVRNIIAQSNCLTTGLPISEFYDYDTLIAEALYKVIVDYVEIESAHMYDMSREWDACDPDLPEDAVLETLEDRREAGLAHLEWEILLKEQSALQSERAGKIVEMYLWIKDVKDSRPDPYDVTGWSAYCDTKEDVLDQEEDEDKQKEVSRMLKEVRELELKYKNEDTQMLIRIIELRDNLWT